MIITKKGEQLRNLEEQVQYLTNYHNVNQGLVQWGIRVVGQVETASELPDPATYKGEYGDAYAVGTEAPFFFYIWTRASIVGESDYWFPFGEISIVGPQGPKGDKGDKGDTGESTTWYISSSLAGSYKQGDKILIIANNSENGNIYTYDKTQGFLYNGNIRGPQGIQGLQGLQGPQGEQGPQGPKGDTGDAGAFINIRGIIDNVGQLPTPASLNNLSAAYLVGGNKELYVQVGEDPDTATWNNIGPLNAATLIMANGLAQNVWNADTKLDKVTSTGLLRAYCVNPDGSQNTISVASNANTWRTDRFTTLVRSTAGSESDRSNMESANVGYLLSPAPTQPFHTANKEYVDKNFAPNLVKDNPDSGLVQAVVLTAKQGPDPRRYAVYSISTSTAGISSGRLVQYFSPNSGEEGTEVGNGRILQHDPKQPYQVANKRYVDNKFLEKDTSATDFNQVYVKAANGGQGTINVTKSTFGDSVVQRQSNGSINVPLEPVGDDDAISKWYLDRYDVKLHHITGYIKHTGTEVAFKVEFNTYSTYPDELVFTDMDPADLETFLRANLKVATSAVTTVENVANYDMVLTINGDDYEFATGAILDITTAANFTDEVTTINQW